VNILKKEKKSSSNCGGVYKAKSRSDNKMYTIKKIDSNDLTFNLNLLKSFILKFFQKSIVSYKIREFGKVRIFRMMSFWMLE